MGALQLADPVVGLLERLDGVKPAGKDSWTGQCPAHEDSRASLSISRGADGRALVHCHANHGCTTTDIAGAVGLSVRDLFADDKPQPMSALPRQIVAVYPYTDEEGAVLFEAVRYTPKDFRQRVPDPTQPGGYRWSLKGVRRVLYRLPEVERAVREDRTVFLDEGEKDSDALAKLGLVATTVPMGAGKATAEILEPLRGARVVLLPDNDDPGREHVRAVFELLRGIAKDVRVVELPGLPEKGDVSDWLAAGHTVEELKDLVRVAPPRVCNLAARASVPALRILPPDEWPEPQPIPTGLRSVEPFSPALLPANTCAWLEDVAERMQVPLDYLAVTLMVSLSSMIGRRVAVRPKERDEWTVVPVLWALIVGRPGVLKTPSVLEVLRLLQRLDAQEGERFREQIRQYETESKIREIADKLARADAEKKLKSGHSQGSLVAEWMATPPPTPPTRRRYIVNDTTVEKLAMILAENPGGVLIHRDELVGFLKGLDRQGQEGARAFYLEAWNGKGRYVSARVSREAPELEGAAVSILGCMQPGILRDYLHSAGDGGAGDDGLLQRFQLAVYPDVPEEWEDVDRPPDQEAQADAFRLFERMSKLTPEDVGAERDPHDEHALPWLRFDASAQAAFKEWRTDLERRLRAEEDHPAFESHLSKFRSLVPTLALVRHVAEGGRGPIGEVSVVSAIAWAKYLESHARRIYAPVIGSDSTPAQLLLTHLQRGDLHDGFTVRDVYKSDWSGLTSINDASRAVELLEQLGWLRGEKQETGGRPTVRYKIHPQAKGER